MASMRELVEAIRSSPGVSRKNAIEEIVDSFPTEEFGTIAAARGEDAAAIDVGDEYILLATDGIMQSLVDADPYSAGYFAVLVNVNDIAAMGGRPIGMVDVMSYKDHGISKEIVRGMKEGVRKFGVPIVGGHTHPDCLYNAVDIAIAGKVHKDALLRSSTARPGDDIVFVMDLDGYFPELLPRAFVTTEQKSDELVRAQMEAVAIVAERHLAHSCKDMSNPGDLGTLGMMLETSGAGGTVDVRLIPIPKDVDSILWHLAYQGCGFVFACPPEHSEEIIGLFEEVGCEGAVVGSVDDTRILRITDGRDTEILFDFEKDAITGCRP